MEDVLSLADQEKEQYDVVIGKAVFDSVICSENSFKNVTTMLRGIQKYDL